MDKQVQKAVKTFIRELTESYPQVKVEVVVYRWADEDATLDILIPGDISSQEENDILDLRSQITGRLFEETGIDIVAVASTVQPASS